MKDEEHLGDRPYQMLVKLRQELGYQHPRLVIPDVPGWEVNVTEVYLDEIYRLTTSNMQPPFDVEAAINKDLLWGREPGYQFDPDRAPR